MHVLCSALCFTPVDSLLLQPLQNEKYSTSDTVTWSTAYGSHSWIFGANLWNNNHRQTGTSIQIYFEGQNFNCR